MDDPSNEIDIPRDENHEKDLGNHDGGGGGGGVHLFLLAGADGCAEHSGFGLLQRHPTFNAGRASAAAAAGRAATAAT